MKDPQRVTVTKVRAAMKALAMWQKVSSIFRTPQENQELEEQMEVLREILGAIGVKITSVGGAISKKSSTYFPLKLTLISDLWPRAIE